MKVMVDIKELPDIKYTEKDLDSLKEAIECYCWFAMKAKVTKIR